MFFFFADSLWCVGILKSKLCLTCTKQIQIKENVKRALLAVIWMFISWNAWISTTEMYRWLKRNKLKGNFIDLKHIFFFTTTIQCSLDDQFWYVAVLSKTNITKHIYLFDQLIERKFMVSLFFSVKVYRSSPNFKKIRSSAPPTSTVLSIHQKQFFGGLTKFIVKKKWSIKWKLEHFSVVPFYIIPLINECYYLSFCLHFFSR